MERRWVWLGCGLVFLAAVAWTVNSGRQATERALQNQITITASDFAILDDYISGIDSPLGSPDYSALPRYQPPDPAAVQQRVDLWHGRWVARRAVTLQVLVARS